MRKSLLLAGAAAVLFTVGAAADSLQSTDVKLKLGQVTFKSGKTLDLTVGIGSALFHMPGDPADAFYAVTDRGPNIDCSAAEKITGMTLADACAGDEKAKLFPRPDFVPSIVKVKLNGDGTFATTDWIPLKDAAGKPISGLSNPLKAAKTEAAYDKDGKQLPFDPQTHNRLVVWGAGYEFFLLFRTAQDERTTILRRWSLPFAGPGRLFLRGFLDYDNTRNAASVRITDGPDRMMVEEDVALQDCRIDK